MLERLQARIQYGRAIREHALSLLEAHGEEAAALARAAAGERGLPDAERLRREAVAARIGRLRAPRPMTRA